MSSSGVARRRLTLEEKRLIWDMRKPVPSGQRDPLPPIVTYVPPGKPEGARLGPTIEELVRGVQEMRVAPVAASPRKPASVTATGFDPRNRFDGRVAIVGAGFRARQSVAKQLCNFVNAPDVGESEFEGEHVFTYKYQNRERAVYAVRLCFFGDTNSCGLMLYI